MSGADLLSGVTVLDLSSVGPAARTSRWLADYGARVVKVGPPPKQSGVQIVPPFYAYSGHRGMERVLLDLKTEAGRDAFLRLAARAGGGGPALPGATIGDAAGGGMQAVIAILAALVQRSATGVGAYLDVSVADGVVALMSLYIDEFLATGEVPGPGHNILTGRYACYDVYRCFDDRWVAVGAIEPHFYANLCRALGCERWLAHQTDDAVQDAIRADFGAAFVTRPRDEWVARLGPADTCVSEVASVPELVRDAHFRARRVFVEASAPASGAFEQVG